jgi:hypothetical protein
MRIRRPALERRLIALIEASPSRVPVVLGSCGSGRTTALNDIRDRVGRERCQYVDLERAATTPEHFHRALCLDSPFVAPDVPLTATSPREAFDATLAFFTGARTQAGEPATFLLDEVLEFRTFENFPGLRHLMRELLAALAASRNRFVLTTRFTTRALRLFRDADPHFEVVQMPALDADEIRDAVASAPGLAEDAEYAARAIHGLTDGHAGYARALIEAWQTLEGRESADPVAALATLLEPDAPFARRIGWSYELRLHRARGYGALKGILGILADDEPLTLTEIALRLQRTPGSTKDYLSWLEDVDLVSVRQKRYSFTDPLVRLWVGVHCRPAPPNDDEVSSAVQQYALARLPTGEPAPALALAGSIPADGDDRKSWGIIEID